jgi:hypothetical protein
MAPAAVLGQERQQRAHAVDVDRVQDPSLVSRRDSEAGALELGQMRGQGRWRDAQPLGDLSGRQADRALTHQEAKDLQPSGVGQRGQRLQRLWRVHTQVRSVSTFHEERK